MYQITGRDTRRKLRGDFDNMAIKTKQEILEKIRQRFGEDTSDETIGLIEDVTDTFDDYERRSADNTEWEKKYNELDAEWRKKYTDRFFSGEPVQEMSEEQPVEQPEENLTYENLFKGE